MRLLLFLILVVHVRSDGCVPMDHLIDSTPIVLNQFGLVVEPGAASAVLKSAQYCEGIDYGGGSFYGTDSLGDSYASCDIEWVWRGSACISDDGLGKTCQCSTSSCRGEPSCQCHMQQNFDLQYCYNHAAACPNCAKGLFAMGCGCMACDNSKTYNNDIYNWAGPACGANELVAPPRYGCGPGSCRACPIGFTCAGGQSDPVPCPPGYYQDKTNSDTCKLCTCLSDQFTNEGSKCSMGVSMDGLCKPCDRCTEGSLIHLEPGVFNLCPKRNYNYGNARVSGTCKACAPCPPKTYALVDSTKHYCITDEDTATECKDYYYTPYGPNTFTTDQNFESNVVVGTMPFVVGWQRNHGSQHKPGPSSNEFAPGLRGYKAVLPYYSPCLSMLMDNATMGNESSIKMLDQALWIYDCDPHLHAMCDPGFYAVTSMWMNFTFVEHCVACPLFSDGGGGRSGTCTCQSEYAMAKAIKSTMPDTTVAFAFPKDTDLNSVCVRCSTEIYLPDPYGGVTQEAMVCPSGGSLPSRCTGLNFVNGTSCSPCPPYFMPNKHRTGCEQCPVGTRMEGKAVNLYYTCTPCDPTVSYQNLTGQSKCEPKRNMDSCPDGTMLKLNNMDAINDNTCEPCSAGCGGGDDTLQIRYPNKTGTCDKLGNPYFGCLSIAHDFLPTFPNNIRFAFVASSDHPESIADAHVVIQECRGNPAYSSWVPFVSSGKGRQCYFACDYGVNKGVADAYHQEVLDYITSSRVDLRDFVSSAASGETESQWPSITMPMMYGYDPAVVVATSWSVRIPLSLDSKYAGAYSDNTFLLLDEKPIASRNICLSPPEAKSASSPCVNKGFLYDTYQEKCALHARTRMYHSPGRSIPTSTGGSGVVVLPSFYVLSENDTPVCRTDTTDLTSFQALCTHNCLEERYQAASALATIQNPDTLWARRLSYIQYYLSADTWINTAALSALKNPYDFSLPNIRCVLDTCRVGTYRYTLGEHEYDASLRGPTANLSQLSACIPCGKTTGDTICGQLYGPNDRRFYNHQTCIAGATNGTQLTAKDVCDICNPTRPYATLIFPGDLSTTNPNALAWDEWLTFRLERPAYGDHFLGWDSVRCRYKCAAGYMSQNSGVDAYNEIPCVPCATPALPGGPVYVDQKSIIRSRATCGGHSYAPFMPRYVSCDVCDDASCAYKDTEHVFKQTLEPVSTRQACLARCDPLVYHTLLAVDRSLLTRSDDFRPLYDIECEPCASNTGIPCAGRCLPGQYIFDDNTCKQCTVTPCSRIDQYLDVCTSGSNVHDSTCLPCNPSLLFNPASSSTNALNLPDMLVEIRNQANLTTRQWVPGGKCDVACVNNHMWIDPSTGLFPPDSPDPLLHVCLPCASRYVSEWIYDNPTARPLYSVWNSTNTTVDTVPTPRRSSPLQAPGACFFCPPDHDTLPYGPYTPMCESKSGYTGQSQGAAGTAIVVTINPTEQQLQGMVTQTVVSMDGFGNRRRLLQLSTTKPSVVMLVRTIAVRAMPVITPSTEYFSCCTNGTETNSQRCKAFNLQELESKKTKEGATFGSDFCDMMAAAGGRRLLQQESSSSVACYAGNYKPTRGDGPCYTCPFGASTASDAADTKTACRCMPGFRAIRDAAGHLKSCTACPDGFHRSPLQTDDSLCYPCPPNTFKPTASSAYCYCLAGSYMLMMSDQEENNSTCTPCTAGFFCQADNVRTPCPLHSTTTSEGSTARSDCKCLSPLYFGDLSDPSQECVYVRPGLNCSSSSSCPCAKGWVTANDNTCVSSCKPGEYAVLGLHQSIERCVPCPVDTYTPTNDAVYIPQLPLHQQCTACPPNAHTAGPGTSSLEGCACLGDASALGCQLCLAGQYYSSKQCMPCPLGTSSPPSSVGLGACTCPRGYRAMRTDTLRCEPCPLGYFAAGVGLSCTPCPPSMTTTFPGAFSRLQCVMQSV